MELGQQFKHTSLLRTWLSFCALMAVVSFSEADYNFTIRFHEFRNPLGLQCGECESGEPPACCDDVQRRVNCTNMPPRICGTRFRFMLRPFGASVESAPNTGFPYFTPGGFDNSRVFTEGPQAFLALQNPFVITRKGEWIRKTQFFIDALDRASNVGEIEAIINRFPIDLELNPGSSFTERTTYTGIYNISDLGFDMSFRVQCSENYYGADCNTFCEPMEGVYTCSSEGMAVCIKANRDPATNCTTCFPRYGPELDCSQCLQGRTLSSGCTACAPGYDPSTNCETCMPGYEITPDSTQCSKLDTQPPLALGVGRDDRDLVGASAALGVIAILLVIALAVLSAIVVLLAIRLRRKVQEKTAASVEQTEEATQPGERNVENTVDNETTQDIVTKEDEMQQDPPTLESSSFPYTLGHNEEASYKLDLTEKGEDDAATTDDNDDIVTGEESKGEEEDGTQVGNLSSVLEDASIQLESAANTEYADIVISTPPDAPDPAVSAPTEHDYAFPEATATSDSTPQQPPAVYTNTTPGVVTQEALSHYDFGQ